MFLYYHWASLCHMYISTDYVTNNILVTIHNIFWYVKKSIRSYWMKRFLCLLTNAVAFWYYGKALHPLCVCLFFDYKYFGMYNYNCFCLWRWLAEQSSEQLCRLWVGVKVIRRRASPLPTPVLGLSNPCGFSPTRPNLTLKAMMLHQTLEH